MLSSTMMIAKNKTIANWKAFKSKSWWKEGKLTRNHLSTHLAWNSCEHGNTRSVWRGSKSQIQMTHDVWSPAWIIKVNRISYPFIIGRGGRNKAYPCAFQRWIYSLATVRSRVALSRAASLLPNVLLSSKALRNFPFHLSPVNMFRVDRMAIMGTWLCWKKF